MAVGVQEPGEQPPAAPSMGHVTELACGAQVIRRSLFTPLPRHKLLA